MSNVKSKWWVSLQSFLLEQHDIEKAKAIRDTGEWTRENENVFRRFAAMLVGLQEIAVQKNKPIAHKSMMKFYKNIGDDAYWKLAVYLWPDGRVEMFHNKVADSKRWIERE